MIFDDTWSSRFQCMTFGDSYKTRFVLYSFKCFMKTYVMNFVKKKYKTFILLMSLDKVDD